MMDVTVTSLSGTVFGRITVGYIRLRSRSLYGRVPCRKQTRCEEVLVELEGNRIGDESRSVDLDVMSRTIEQEYLFCRWKVHLKRYGSVD